MGALSDMVGEIRLEFDDSGLDKAESQASNLGDTAQNVGSKMQSVGSTMTKGFTAPIAAGFAGSAKAAADFESQMVEVEKVTDPETANRMSEAIKGMAAEMPVAHEELATIAETAGRLGVESENLEDFTETVAKMSAATDLSAEEAADSFARISSLMDYPIEKSEELGSAMNELANNFGTSTSEITDVMTRAGGAFNALGLGEDQALGLSAAMNEVSPSSRLAAGGLKRISEMLMDPKKVNKIADAFGMTSGELQQMIDNDPSGVIKMLAEEMQTGSETSKQLRSDLGKQASELTTLGSNWDAVEDATSMANDQLEEGTSLQKEFDAASDTMSSQLQVTKNQLRNVGIAIGEALLPYLRTFNDMVQAVSTRLMNMSDSQRTLIVGVAALVAAIGPLLLVFGTILTMVPSMIAGWATLTAAFGTVATALSGGLIPSLVAVVGAINPIIWVIGAAIGAAALLAAAWKSNFGGIRDHTQRVVDVFMEEFGPAIEWLKGAVSDLMSYLGGGGGGGGGLSASFASVATAAKPLIPLIANDLILAIRGLADVTRATISAMKQAWTTLEPIVRTAVQGILTFLDILYVTGRGLFQVAMNVWQGKWSEAWLGIYNIFADIAGRIIGFLSDTFMPGLDDAMAGKLGEMRLQWVLWGQRILATVFGTFNKIKATITTVLGTIQAAVEPYLNYLRVIWMQFSRQILMEAKITWQAIKTQIMPVLNWLRASIPPVLSFLQAQWRAFKSAVVPVVRTLATVVKTVIGALMVTLRTVISTGLNAIRGFWSVFGDDIKAIARMAATTVMTIIGQLMDTIKTVIIVGLRVIRGDWSGAWDAITGYADRTTGRIKSLISGWVDVIVGHFKTLKSDGVGLVRDLMSSIVDRVRGGISDFKTAGKDLIAAFADGIESRMRAVKNAVDDIVQAARDRLPGSDAKRGPLSDLTDTGPALVDTFAEGIMANKSEAERAAEAVAEAARGPFEGLGENIPTLDDLAEKYGESSPAAMEEALSYLDDTDIHRLADELKNTKWIEGDMWSDGFENAKSLIEDARKNGIGQNLYDALITQGGGYHALDEILQMKTKGPKQGMTRTEDGTWVDPSFYNKPARPQSAAPQDSGGTEVTLDFSGVPEDAYISVEAFKEMANEQIKKQQHRDIKKATNGTFST